MADDLMSDSDFGLQSDEQFMGSHSAGGNTMSDKEFGLMSDDDFMGGPNGATAAAPDQGNDQATGAQPTGVAPEGPVARGVRNVAHGVAPAVGGYMGAVPGAELGASIGAAAGPIGAAVGGVAGGLVGAFAGGYAAEKAAHVVQDATGFNDDEQMAANVEAHPTEAAIEGAIPAFAGMRFDKGATALARAGSAALQGGIDVAQQAQNKGWSNIDPAEALAIPAAGAVLPSTNRLGEAVSNVGKRLVPGRPGRAANPAAEVAHQDVGDDSVETAVGDSVLAESPPHASGETIGAAVENRPTNSRGEVATGKADGSYAKGAAPSDTSHVTAGDVDPATAAALDAANPAPAPQAQPTPQAPAQAQPPAQRPLGMPARNFRVPTPDDIQAALDRHTAATEGKGPEPVVEAGFPEEGAPVAAGANDAAPVPHDMAEQVQAAIERHTAATEAPKAEPQFKGETPVNDSITDGQKIAGNFPKAETREYGRKVTIETHAGDIRRSKPGEPPWEVESPYHYGDIKGTKGADGDNVDIAMPDMSDPAWGNKHFVIDQKNAETGKFDEHKMFANYKDEAAARDHYNRGFSDGKGPDRLGAITEVDRPAAVKLLIKATQTPWTKPYKMVEAKVPKSVKDKAVFKDLVAKKPELAAALQNAPDEVVAKAIEGKRLRKYGVSTGNSNGWPIEGILNSEGKPITANTKAKAQDRSDIHNAVREFFGINKDTAGLEKGPALDKIRAGLDALHSYDVFKKNKARLFGDKVWQPTFKPKEWMWAREATKLLTKPTDGQWKKFTDADRLLRGGDEAVQNYRDSNRTEADIAMSKRSGDEAVAGAEAKNVDLGRNTEEDKLIAAIDAKRGGRFDVPHEEAEEMVTPRQIKTAADIKEAPQKEVHVNDSELAKIDLKKVDESAAAKRRAEAAALVGKKTKQANIGSEDRQAGKGISVKDKFNDPEVLAKMIEASNKAAKKGAAHEEDLNREDLTKQASGRPKFNEVARLFGDFANDEGGALHVGKIAADIKKAMGSARAAVGNKLGAQLKHTPVDNFSARKPNPVWEPNAEYTRKASDELHTLENQNTLHEQHILHAFLQKLPKEALENDSAPLKRIHNAMEADSAHLPLPAGATSHMDALSPADKKIWNDHLKPFYDEADSFHQLLKNIDPERAGPDVEHYMARITKGNTAEFNALKRSDDPVARRNGFAMNASMANERPFVALENVKTGERHVIQNRPEGGFTLWKNQKATRIKDPNYEFEANAPYTVKGKGGNVDYIMRHATTDEVMKSGARFDLGKDKNGKKVTMPAKYHQNAALSIALSHAKLGAMTRNIVELARISSTPEFRALTTTRPTKEQIAAGWKEGTMPNFKGTSMAPELREVFDDFAGPAGDGWDGLRNLNSAVTKLLFWTPTAHIMNVGAHWFVGRGWDNLNLKRGFDTSMRAAQSVWKQDHIQKEMMENGASNIFPSVQTRDMIGQIAKMVGEKMDDGPKSPIRAAAEAAGVPVKAVHDWIYNNSSKVMWAANDMFLTQRYLELKQKGYSPKEAIARAERDIPNYRIPTRIGTGGGFGRTLSLAMQDNRLLAFSRYHVGMLNAYRDILRNGNPFNDATVADRVEALGKVFSLGLLAAAYPLADKAAQLITGNDEATQNRRGPLAIPSHLYAASQGKEDMMSAARTTMVLQPLVSTFWETVNNKDFRGKNIVEPDDLAAGAHGDVKRGAKAATQFGEHAARGLISPLGTLESAAKKGLNPATAVRDQVLDEKNPSDAAKRFAAKQPIINHKNSVARDKKGGSGILEGLFD